MFLEIWILVDRYAAIAIEHSAYEMSILMCRHILLNLSHIQIHALVVRKTIRSENITHIFRADTQHAIAPLFPNRRVTVENSAYLLQQIDVFFVQTKHKIIAL